MTSDDDEDVWRYWDEPKWTESHSRILSEIKDELVDELMEIYRSDPRKITKETVEKILSNKNPFMTSKEIRPTFFRLAHKMYGGSSYCILESTESSIDLASKVTIAMWDGWKPLGSVSFGHGGIESSNKRDTIFAQAMMMED